VGCGEGGCSIMCKYLIEFRGEAAGSVSIRYETDDRARAFGLARHESRRHGPGEVLVYQRIYRAGWDEGAGWMVGFDIDRS
jgi:hypothetical protein